jgi:hypothetical protein
MHEHHHHHGYSCWEHRWGHEHRLGGEWRCHHR